MKRRSSKINVILKKSKPDISSKDKYIIHDSKTTKSYRQAETKRKSQDNITDKKVLAFNEHNVCSKSEYTLYETSDDTNDDKIVDGHCFENIENSSEVFENQEDKAVEENLPLIEDDSVYSFEKRHFQTKRHRASDKALELPVPHHINQYGDCLKTYIGRCNFGLTLTDPPCNFFQGVLKGVSGQTLAVLFGDTNLIAKFEDLPLEDIGHFVFDTAFNIKPVGTEGVNNVFTISLLYQNTVIPLWYAVMSCSSAELYKRILIEFQQHVLDWPFISALMNNDPALNKALQTVFPGIDIYGSWFYYCHSIWKEVNLNNLTEECKVLNSTLLMAVKLLMVMPYLPPPSMENTASVSMVDGFQYVREFATENNLPEGFNRVLDYVAIYWFNKVTPENFTVFGKHTDTLNYVETLQLLLLSFMKENANVWELTRSFQCMARSTLGDFNRLLNGKRLISKKNTRGKRFNPPIRLNMKRLMGRTLDVKTFLEKSTIYLEEMLDIFLHPLYLATNFEKTNYSHTEGWAVRIFSE
ncbi:uncharacterized protein LOC128988662 isoform X2 [Macrosteles quadrilineatus]|uniref:uncharacterized protein LOC128988662 isoform X2 n=1 Tax=Macrosteles quadrilineatus TaxID=74068 RepID=UPI0023E18E53|nr:uncharacterized protein LOC128988662 isoform X2 [Macrosteles quadrilineatus]